MAKLGTLFRDTNQPILKDRHSFVLSTNGQYFVYTYPFNFLVYLLLTNAIREIDIKYQSLNLGFD